MSHTHAQRLRSRLNKKLEIVKVMSKCIFVRFLDFTRYLQLFNCILWGIIFGINLLIASGFFRHCRWDSEYNVILLGPQFLANTFSDSDMQLILHEFAWYCRVNVDGFLPRPFANIEQLIRFNVEAVYGKLKATSTRHISSTGNMIRPSILTRRNLPVW